eukprot:TRINITY_DN3988_c0_g1_i6.p1 TRINITY_DN3988_c0_g1~~TRINITY_DN3988_c0_g1_i6.p1  ORF type:complete len:1019 (+),score=284.58 TRINITY_DN3988_c0_g1_i6:503-3559(+)
MSQGSRMLLAEGLAQYGTMLLILEELLPGPVRESIIVSYYRYNGKSAISDMSNVVKLCATNSALKEEKRADYIIEVFARFPIDQRIIIGIIEHIKNEDIYNQMKAYPDSQQKTTALASQASLLYVLLYFVPSILQDNADMMRDIVNKHFSDNWIISYFQGFTVDLFEAWRKFKAAAGALNKIITSERVKELIQYHKKNLIELKEQLSAKVLDRLHNQDYILENTSEFFNRITLANVTLRWLILHSTSSKLHEALGAVHKDTLDLLLHTSEFENKFKSTLKDLLTSKQSMFDERKARCLEYMNECAEYFAGNRNLGQVIKNEEYAGYFKEMGKRVEGLKCRPLKTPSAIQGFTNSLNSVVQNSHMTANVQIKFYINESLKILREMAIVASLRKDSLNRLALVTDFSYAWNLLDCYIDLMHQSIISDTKALHLFVSFFLKLASILNLPLRRIIEVNDEEKMDYVSQYYSSQLVSFVGRALSAIPTTIFQLLGEITKSLTAGLKTEQAFIHREEYLACALFEERYRLAREAHKISLLAEGMLAIDKCLLGVIEIDPKEFLANGIKNEVVKAVSSTLNSSLVFRKDVTTESFETAVKQVASKLDNMRNSLEYMQEFIGIDALSIWLEQMSRIIRFYVSKEATRNPLERTKQDAEEKEKNLIEIPMYDPIDNSPTFLGRLLSGLMNITSPSKQLYYFSSRNSWHDHSGAFIFGPRTVLTLSKAFGVVGVSGLDQVISYYVKKGINSFAREYKHSMTAGNRAHIQTIRKEVRYRYESEATEVLRTGVERAIEGLAGVSRTLIAFLEQIGRLQLIRKVIQQQLMQLAVVESKGFYQVIDNLNRCALPHFAKAEDAAIENNEQTAEKREKEVEFLNYVSALADSMGMSDPLNKIYAYPKCEMFSISHMLAVITIDYLKNVVYKPNADIFLRKRFAADSPDAMALLVGTVTMLRHMHENYSKEYIATLCYYAKMTTALEFARRRKERLPVNNVQVWLNQYCKVTEQSRDIIARIASNFLLDSFACAI